MDNATFTLVQASGLLECIDDAYRERGDWRQLVLAFADAVRAAECESLRNDAERLHTAVCQAVALMNRSTEIDLTRCAEGREALDILRQVLIDHADAAMAQPTKGG
jgi:hypothetical protein